MLNRLLCLVLIAGWLSLGFGSELRAEGTGSVFDSDYIEINLTLPDKTQPINIHISPELSRKFQFLPGQNLSVQVYVRSLDNKNNFIKDIQGQDKWQILLDQQGRGSLTFLPAKINYTGRLAVLANQKVIHNPGLLNSRRVATLEFVREYKFEDDAAIKVHFTSQIMEAAGIEQGFPEQVLEAAQGAYEKIVDGFGFNRQGYSFSRPDQTYAYDEDKTIDIYLGSRSGLDNFEFHSLSQQDFKRAPFYEVRYQGRYRYSTVIALPADYQTYLKAASKQFGYSQRVDIVSHLNAAVMHEMLHIVTFYYNKNLASWPQADWYVEGLARYVETIAGFNGNFYSQACQPGRDFSQSGYDFAAFWQYFHRRFGMEAIEKMSYQLRSAQLQGPVNQQAAEVIRQVTGISFSKILQDFSEFVQSVAANI